MELSKELIASIGILVADSGLAINEYRLALSKNQPFIINILNKTEKLLNLVTAVAEKEADAESAGFVTSITADELRQSLKRYEMFAGQSRGAYVLTIYISSESKDGVDSFLDDYKLWDYATTVGQNETTFITSDDKIYIYSFKFRMNQND